MQTLHAPAAVSGKDLLLQHPLFGDLPERYLAVLAECTTEVHFHAGEVIFVEGQDANRFYLIREGEVALETFRLDSGPPTIQTFSDGDAFGWSWLVPPYRWRFDARAVVETYAIAFDGVRLRDLCERTPELGYELFKRVAVMLEHRLQAVRLHLLGLSDGR